MCNEGGFIRQRGQNKKISLKIYAISARTSPIFKGTITNATGNETGVTVNGIVAMVYGNLFVANHIPLEEGENTITASATDTAGNTATSSITVSAEAIGLYIRITADEESGVSGVSPFETTLKVGGSFTFTEEPIITYEGPGVVEFLDNPEPNEYDVRIATPGIYYFTAEVTDDQSNTYSDTIAMVILDLVQLDALLRAKWNNMKAALIDGDIQRALSYHHGTFKERYESIYNLLQSEISSIAQQMKELEFIFAEGDRAKYATNRDHNIDGQIVTITYYVYFSQDEKGLWKIERY